MKNLGRNKELCLSAWTVQPLFEGALYTCNVDTGRATKVGTFQGGDICMTGFSIPYIITTPPETPECPKGPTEGVVGVEYAFSTRTTDPEGEQVYYMWDWGDGTPSGWLGPYNSGDIVLAHHTWTEAGIYNVTVKAKDFYNRESDWSDPKMIHIVDGPILEIGNISGGLFKVSTVIKNTGDTDATGVNWSITLDGGFILLGEEISRKIASIPAEEEVTISSKLIPGFGKTMVIITAETPDVSNTKEQDAFMVLFFIKI